MASLGKNLQLQRISLDMTQAEAAEKIGVSIAAYGRWERGDSVPSKAHIKLIAQAFGLSEAGLNGLAALE